LAIEDILGPQTSKKLYAMPLSNDTVQMKIINMTMNVKV